MKNIVRHYRDTAESLLATTAVRAVLGATTVVFTQILTSEPMAAENIIGGAVVGALSGLLRPAREWVPRDLANFADAAYVVATASVGIAAARGIDHVMSLPGNFDQTGSDVIFGFFGAELLPFVPEYSRLAKVRYDAWRNG